MKLVNGFAAILLSTLLFQGASAQHSHHSDPPSSEDSKSEKTYLLDEFGRLGHCEFGSRFDIMFTELHDNPTIQGYVIFYPGADLLPADLGSTYQRRFFENHMAFRNFDKSRVTIIDGGFRDGAAVEIWMVRPGGEPPTPSRTIPKPTVPTDKTLLFDRKTITTTLYVETFGMGEGPNTDDLAEFVIPAVAARLAAEQAEWQRQQDEEAAAAAAEAEASGEVTEPEIVEESEAAESEPEKPLTPEEIEAARFSWTSDKFAPFLDQQKDSRGVIIFYADNEMYDIAKLRTFVDQGLQRMAKEAGIDPSRMTIEFGGYSSTPDLEFWIVPKKGTAPVATPEERPVPEPEEDPEPVVGTVTSANVGGGAYARIWP